jgi:hypothetical protein
MNSQSLPSLRIDPDLHKAAEMDLKEGESLSSFVESPLRGLASRDHACTTGHYEDARLVVEELQKMLFKARMNRS